MLLEGEIRNVIEQTRNGRLLGREVVARSGDLEVVDNYFGGNIGFGRHHPSQLTLLKIGDETIVRRIEVNDKLNVPTAFVLSIPPGKDVSMTLHNRNGSLADLSVRDVNFIYAPEGLQLHGKIGKTAFVTDGYAEIRFGGKAAWGPIGNSIVMNGHHNIVRLGEDNLSEMLGDTGILVARWTE